MENFLNMFNYFIIYSIIGFIGELVWLSILHKKIVKSTGFLIGPYCPIYGFGSLIIIYILTKYHIDPVALFLQAIIYCTVLEYITGFLMEKLFHQRWWDYSNELFNLNGRICLKNSVAFGISALGLVYLIQPMIIKIYEVIPLNLELILSIIIFIIILMDLIFSIITVLKIRNILKDIKIVAKTKLININIKHLLKKFPSLVDNNNIFLIKKIIEEKIRNKIIK